MIIYSKPDINNSKTTNYSSNLTCSLSDHNLQLVILWHPGRSEYQAAERCHADAGAELG